MRKSLFCLFLFVMTLPAFSDGEFTVDTQIAWNSKVVVDAIKPVSLDQNTSNRILVDLLGRDKFSVGDAVRVCRSYCDQSKALQLYQGDCPAVCEQFGKNLVLKNNENAVSVVNNDSNEQAVVPPQVQTNAKNSSNDTEGESVEETDSQGDAENAEVADKAFTEEADVALRIILKECNDEVEQRYDENVNSYYGMNKIKQNPLFSMVTDEIKHKFDHYLESQASGEQVCKKIADKTFNEDELDGMLDILMTLSREDVDVFLMLLDIHRLFDITIKLAFNHYSLEEDSVSTQVSSLQEAENWVRNRIKAQLGDENKLNDGTEIIDLSHLKCTGECNWIPGSQDYVTCTLGPLQKTFEFDDICNHGKKTK